MGCRGRDRMVDGFTTTYAINAYIYFDWPFTDLFISYFMGHCY
jgi:hypothetical protein